MSKPSVARDHVRRGLSRRQLLVAMSTVVCIAAVLAIIVPSHRAAKRLERDYGAQFAYTGNVITGVVLPWGRIDDAGLPILRKLWFMQGLRLEHGPITNHGLKEVGKLRRLVRLTVRRMEKVTDEGVAHLGNLQRLEHLDLVDLNITDRALEIVVRLRKLEEINVRETRITDRGLEMLADLPKLKRLYVFKTRVTVAGVQAFRTRRPDVRLHSSHD